MIEKILKALIAITAVGSTIWFISTASVTALTIGFWSWVVTLILYEK